MSNQQAKKRYRIIIIILLILLLISIFALIARIVYLKHLTENAVTTVLPDNTIGNVSDESLPENNSNTSSGTTNSVSAPIIFLYKGNSQYNVPFNVENMFPGDISKNYFAVRVLHSKPISLCFSTETTDETKNLSNVLNIKIKNIENGKILYDGSFSEIASTGYSLSLPSVNSGETTVFYEITVGLPESCGNEYQNALLKADFNWFVKDDNLLNTPPTGYNPRILSYIAVALSSFFILLVLPLLYSSKKGETNEK